MRLLRHAPKPERTKQLRGGIVQGPKGSELAQLAAVLGDGLQDADLEAQRAANDALAKILRYAKIAGAWNQVGSRYYLNYAIGGSTVASIGYLGREVLASVGYSAERARSVEEGGRWVAQTHQSEFGINRQGHWPRRLAEYVQEELAARGFGFISPVPRQLYGWVDHHGLPDHSGHRGTVLAVASWPNPGHPAGRVGQIWRWHPREEPRTRWAWIAWPDEGVAEEAKASLGGWHPHRLPGVQWVDTEDEAAARVMAAALEYGWDDTLMATPADP